MQFKVTGTSKATGARMVLEFEAESKAQAERKAMQQGMNVTRAENVSDGEVPKSYPTGAAGRGSKRGSPLGTLLAVVILVGIIYAGCHFWPQIQAIISKK